MNYRLFQYALPAPPELEDLNAYLGSHRVASVSRELVQTGNGAMLVFIVETVAGKAPPGTPPEPSKIDCREVFNDADFAVFSRLRDERKKIALAGGVPIYTVFSNAQLAEMVKRRVRTVADLSRVEGIGEGRCSQPVPEGQKKLAGGEASPRAEPPEPPPTNICAPAGARESRPCHRHTSRSTTISFSAPKAASRGLRQRTARAFMNTWEARCAD